MWPISWPKTAATSTRAQRLDQGVGQQDVAEPGQDARHAGVDHDVPGVPDQDVGEAEPDPAGQALQPVARAGRRAAIGSARPGGRTAASTSRINDRQARQLQRLGDRGSDASRARAGAKTS